MIHLVHWKKKFAKRHGFSVWKEPGSIFVAPSFQVFVCISKSPWCHLFPRQEVSALSAFPHGRDVPVAQSPGWPCSGSSPVCSCLSCAEESRTGPSTPGTALPVLSTGEGSPVCICWYYYT